MEYKPDLLCKCGHAAKEHRKYSDENSDDGISFNLMDCTRCQCHKFC